ncbi:hypothetical protein EST38_g4887 [Candolleomyces aberdarensis]|uniref:Uncharacterized protein n=1 Tax=Candolleomyces aberdarensis TaxID=2316362 RepID=A0A4Q2DLG6_9AGAR|nr:hypothetical protein EST38_g4887 [Candolleomyces aberdarensis]
MDPPGEQRNKPRKRDQIKKFLKDPFGSRAPPPSLSRITSHPTVAEGSGTTPQAAHDVAVPTPRAENTTSSEIQSDQDNINIAIEAIPSPSAQDEENTFITSTSIHENDGPSQFSSSFPPRSPGEGEVQGTIAHVENPIQDHGAAVAESDPSGLSPPAESKVPATAVNEPQENTTHAEHQLVGLAGKIYEGVKTTLQKVVKVSDVFPPVKSIAAGLLVICDTIDAYSENKEEFDALLKRVEVLSRIMESCPANVPQEAKDRFDGLLRTLERNKKILQDKVDPTRSRVERVMLAEQDEQEMLKLTQEVRFAIEIAMFDVIIDNRVQTFRIVSGVDWLKEQFKIIEDHTKTMGDVKQAVESLKRSSTAI